MKEKLEDFTGIQGRVLMDNQVVSEIGGSFVLDK